MRKVLVTAAIVATVVVAGFSWFQSGTPHGVILFIADGCGPASFTLARDYRADVEKAPLLFDELLTGAVITRSADSRVTDSAASATAYACGVKTNNGMIAVTPDSLPVATLLEGAERAGRWTGLVSTARITHATPASFSAHVPDRADEDEIAAQQIQKGIELLLGGGGKYFKTREAGGERKDHRDLMAEAADLGYRLVHNRDELLAATSLPVLGLFDDDHMDYELDRSAGNQPSLAEMTDQALKLLSDSPDGFFLMVEAGRIDHAGHANDIAAHLDDILAYEDAMRVALAYARSNGKTLIVATSDHETGGLSLGRQLDGNAVYNWNPQALTGMHRSMEFTMERIRNLVYSDSATSARGERALELTQLAVGDVGMTPAIRAAAAEVMAGTKTRSAFERELRSETARQAVVDWTTTGHTGVDVPLFSYGPGSDQFGGSLDNTQIGLRLAAVLELDLTALTRELQAIPKP